MVRFHALHDSRRYTIPRCLGPSHPDTNARCTAMTIRPYKPRDSARSALLTAVRYRRSALPCTPERRVLHGLAAPPNWRGEIRVRRQTQSPDPAEMPVKRHSIKRAHSTFEDGKRKEREKQLRTQKTSHPQREAQQNIIPYQLLYHSPEIRK
jgi:hypothetical protein